MNELTDQRLQESIDTGDMIYFKANGVEYMAGVSVDGDINRIVLTKVGESGRHMLEAETLGELRDKLRKHVGLPPA